MVRGPKENLGHAVTCIRLVGADERTEASPGRLVSLNPGDAGTLWLVSRPVAVVLVRFGLQRHARIPWYPDEWLMPIPPETAPASSSAEAWA
jgi:hypothetical protein